MSRVDEGEKCWWENGGSSEHVFIFLFSTPLITLLHLFLTDGSPKVTHCKTNTWPTVYGHRPIFLAQVKIQPTALPVFQPHASLPEEHSFQDSGLGWALSSLPLAPIPAEQLVSVTDLTAGRLSLSPQPWDSTLLVTAASVFDFLRNKIQIVFLLLSHDFNKMNETCYPKPEGSTIQADNEIWKIKESTSHEASKNWGHSMTKSTQNHTLRESPETGGILELM